MTDALALPQLYPVNPWTETTYEGLYRVFCAYVKGGKLSYRNFTVWHFPNMEDGKEAIFWHLTTREDKEAGHRLPDLRRCERLPWVNPLLLACPHAEILDWDYEEGNKDIRTYVWVKDYNFLIIMKKYKDGRRRLITSYWIDQDNKRQKLEKKYKRRMT